MNFCVILAVGKELKEEQENRAQQKLGLVENKIPAPPGSKDKIIPAQK